MRLSNLQRLATILLAALASGVCAQSRLLSDATSFEVHETLGANAKLIVQVIRPVHVKVVLTGNNGKNGSITCDGSGAHEYHEWTNSWSTLELAPNGKYPSVLLDMAGVDILESGGKLPELPGYHVSTTRESLNGRATLVTAALSDPHPGHDRTTFQNEQKLWCDAYTGMPLRRVQGVLSGGKERVFQDLTFDEIQLNVPLQISWQPPARSKEDMGIPFLAAGMVAPNFSVVTQGGRNISLSDFKGKIVILDFWATWCGPCQRAMPHLQQAYEHLKNEGVVVLGVCVWDERKAYDQWVAQKSSEYTFRTVFDPAGRGRDSIASKLYGVQAIPTQYVIDKDGKIVAGYIPGVTKVDPLAAAMQKLGLSLGQ